MNAQTKHIREQARAAYKRKDYAKALELFSRAVGRSPSVQLYDNRAACHEKLEDYPAALKDAKKSIQLAKEDPTGYVRAGRILIKMERKSVALEIYAHGLKCVKHVGQGFELLKKVHLELATELSPPKSVDPMTVLPRELAEQILDYLNFRQVINTCRVSKQWANFIRRTSNLWRHLDLTLAKRKVKNAFVSRAINIGRSKLKSATLNNLFDFDKALAALARHCPLEELTLRNTGLLTNDIVDTLKPVKTLKAIRIQKGTTMGARSLSDIFHNAATTIETLHCENIATHQGANNFLFPQCDFPSLQSLDLSWTAAWTRTVEMLHKPSLDRMPNLRSLKLHQLGNKYSIGLPPNTLIDLTGLRHLCKLDLILDVTHAGDLLLPSCLQSFAIGTWRPRHAKFFDDVATSSPVQWHLPLLEELRMCLHEIPFDSFDLALRARAPQSDQKPAFLHTLSMTASTAQGSLTKETLSHPRLAELKHLSLEACHGVDDRHLSLIASTLPQLKSLNVSATEVTGAGIKEIINKGLTKLVANDCRFIGIDAIHWARAQGVQVEHGSTDVMSGGKKLRY